MRAHDIDLDDEGPAPARPDPWARLLAAVARSGGWVQAREVATAGHCSPSRASSVLAMMHHRGQVERRATRAGDGRVVWEYRTSGNVVAGPTCSPDASVAPDGADGRPADERTLAGQMRATAAPRWRV